MESHGVDIRHKATCGVDDTKIRLCVQEYGVVANYKGKAYDG